MPVRVMKQLDFFKNKKFSDCELNNCTICPLARQTRKPFPLSRNRAEDIFHLIHVDIWGPYKVPTYNENRYFLTLVDKHSKMIWIFLMKLKNDTIVVLNSFLKIVHTQFGKTVKVLRTDNDAECFSHECRDYLTDNDILHQSSCPHIPQQNRVVERRHRHVLEVARALRFQGSIPLQFWGDSVLAAVYLINRLLSSILAGKSSYEIFHKKPPNMAHLRTIGCLCLATVTERVDKFSPRAITTVHMGYSVSQKGYKLYDLRQRKFFVSIDVTFKEDIFPLQLGKDDAQQTPMFLELKQREEGHSLHQ